MTTDSTINRSGSATLTFHRLPLSSQKVLAILGLSDPGTRLRFYRSTSRAGHILVCTRDERHLSPTAENLRRLGVSFIQGEEMTLLGREGNPDNAPFIIPVSAYEADPRAFHVEVMSALMMDPAAAELMLGLELLSMEERVQGWLHLA